MSAEQLWAVLVLILLTVQPLRAEEMVVAVIKSRDIAPYNQAVKGFEEHLKRNGMNPWLVPFVLDAGGASPESLVEEVRRKKPALILTLGTKATEAAAASIDDLPIVYGILLNPGPAITKSRNVTGVLMDIPFDAQFEVLRSIIPGARVIGFLYSDPETAAVVADAEAAALRLGLKILALPVRSERDIPDQLRKLKGKADVLWMIADGTVYTPRSTEFILQEDPEAADSLRRPLGQVRQGRGPVRHILGLRRHGCPGGRTGPPGSHRHPAVGDTGGNPPQAPPRGQPPQREDPGHQGAAQDHRPGRGGL